MFSLAADNCQPIYAWNEMPGSKGRWLVLSSLWLIKPCVKENSIFDSKEKLLWKNVIEAPSLWNVRKGGVGKEEGLCTGPHTWGEQCLLNRRILISISQRFQRKEGNQRGNKKETEKDKLFPKYQMISQNCAGISRKDEEMHKLNA